jgi:transposase
VLLGVPGREEEIVLHVGLDLSRRRVDVCLISSEGELVGQFPAPADRDGLYGLTRRVAVYDEPVRWVIESMNGARFVQDELVAHGWEVLIADALRVKGLAPLVCKTDKIDSRVLAELSFRDLVPAIFGVAGRRLLKELDDLVRRIGEIESELRRSGADHRYIPLLVTAPGIGWINGFTIACELGDINRFCSPKSWSATPACARGWRSPATSTAADRMGCWSSGCWMRGCGCWRCIPTRSPRRGRGFVSRAASLTGLTRSCCASLREPTTIASACSSPTATRLRALRALSRAREDLVHAKVALTNQLRSELERFWPGPIGLFSDLDSEISLAFLERYPFPAVARGLGEARLAAFLARQHYRGRRKPAQLLAKLRRAPGGRVGEAELEARRQLVLGLVGALKPLVCEIKAIERQLATALRDHPDGEISPRCSAGPTR